MWLAGLANGYECGFSACWPPASRLMLDRFFEAWVASTGTVQERLAAAFDRSRERFAAEARALITYDADFPEDLPGAVLLAVANEGTTVHAAWIGGDIAILARGFSVIAETTPHTLRERYKREHPEHDVDLNQIPNVLVRTIGPGTGDQDPPTVASFEIEPGDTLILLSKATFHGPCVPLEQAAFAAAVHACPEVLAERLAELAFAGEDAPYAAVAVLRFDALDVSAEIRRLIDEYEPDPGHEGWLRDWAREHRALPVAFDMGGAIGMRPDGSVVSVEWEDPAGSTREETVATALLAAILGASRNYSTLEPLAPRRPAGAEPCLHCAFFSSPAEEPRGCPICWYLGWGPPEPPPWFHLPLQHVGPRGAAHLP